MGELIAKIFVASLLGTIGYVLAGPIGSVVGCIGGFFFTTIGDNNDHK